MSAKASKPSRLGRGLDALIPTEVDEFASREVSETLHLESEDAIHKISVGLVDPNPFQPRKEFREEDLADLAASIKEHGVVQPLVATKQGDRYQLIAGERRLRASKLAGKKTVPVILRSFDEQQQLEVAVIENIQRAELSPLELAVAYQKLIDQFNLTTEAIAGRVGKAAPTVRNILRLLKLPYEAKKALQEGQIVEGQARAILTIEDSKDQLKMLDMITHQEMTVRQAEEIARNWKQDKELISKRVEKKISDYQSIIDGLEKHLGTKVEVLNNAQGGRVVIRFYSQEELTRIYEDITGETLV
ncbi:ParB/RepB/Spo0J family partition protein [bacterium]|nr:MAG: ParB/RepB/Spo0J family partition protein [bacterium]